MTQLQTPPKADALIVHDDGPIAHLFDSARFAQMQRIAIAMAHASLIPDHLHGDSKDPKQRWDQTVANCLMVVNQALRWDMDPFAVAPETYVVHGKLGYQGKLVGAVVHARGNLKGRLGYSFHGEGHGRTVTVAGQFLDETEARTITLSVGQAITDNKMWQTDPDQKLVYSGVTKWARRHCPELMLGVLTLDDLDRMAPSRMDGQRATDHAAQALQLRESKARPPEAPPDPAPRWHPQLDDKGIPLPNAPETPPAAASEPPSIGAYPADHVPEVPQPKPQAEEMTIEVAGQRAADIENNLLAEIETAKSITAIKGIENGLDDTGLPDDGIARLHQACEYQRVSIRTKRGLGKGPR